MSEKQWKTKDGHIKESAIKEAQEIMEAVMTELDLSQIVIIREIGVAIQPYKENHIYADRLADLYIDRLHELNGTTTPPF